MKKNYAETAGMYLNWDQFLLIKRNIFENLAGMADQEKDIACEIIHEINDAMEDIREKQSSAIASSEVTSNEISV